MEVVCPRSVVSGRARSAPQLAKRERFMALRARGWSILAAEREVSVSRTSGMNWSRGYKTYRNGKAVAFVQGAVGPVIRGRGVRPCSTASWWRRTRISMYLVVSDRVCAPSADHAGRPAVHERAGHGAVCAVSGTHTLPAASTSPAETSAANTVRRRGPCSGLLHEYQQVA